MQEATIAWRIRKLQRVESGAHAGPDKIVFSAHRAQEDLRATILVEENIGRAEPLGLRWVLGLSFIAMAVWTLIPDKLGIRYILFDHGIGRQRLHRVTLHAVPAAGTRQLEQLDRRRTDVDPQEWCICAAKERHHISLLN